MWHTDSPATSPSRGGGRTHSNSRAGTEQHPRPTRALAAGRQTRGAPGPRLVRLRRGNTRPRGPYHLAQFSPGPVFATSPTPPAPTRLRAPLAASHAPPFLSGATLPRDAPGDPTGKRWTPPPRPARPSHTGPPGLARGRARAGSQRGRPPLPYALPGATARPGRGSPPRRAGAPTPVHDQGSGPAALRPPPPAPSPRLPRHGLGRGPRSATWPPRRTPAAPGCGAGTHPARGPRRPALLSASPPC